MKKTTKINKFKEEIGIGLEKMALDISDSLIEEFQGIISNAYKKQDIDALEKYLNSLNDMIIADYSDINFLNDVFEDGQLSIKGIELCLSDFHSFIDELEESFCFISDKTLIDVAIEILENEVLERNIPEELANMIDENLYCDYLENLGYIETENGVLYTY